MTDSTAALAPLTLTDTLAARGPNVIGATGGSGTRVLARIVRDAGMYIGVDLNRYDDALPFGAYSDRWIGTVVRSPDLDEATRAAMLSDLESLVERHCADLPATASRWGWKEPRSIYLLPLFSAAFPTLRYLHFVRDGRDMAFSENQQQLRKHGNDVLGRWKHRLRPPLRSIMLWTEVNTRAADFGEQMLGDRYLRVRFEDLCERPGPTVRRVFDFFGLEGDTEAIGAAEVKPPPTLARWRAERPATVSALEEIAGPALRRFGYV